MDYKNYLAESKENLGDNDQCRLSGTCSQSPSLAFLHEFIISYLKELSFYLLKLKELGINNAQIKDDVINIVSGIVINVEYNEDQFFDILSKLYSNLLQAKELYISVCKRNDIKGEYPKSKVKLQQSLSFSDAISKGQQIFKNKFDNFSTEQIRLYELFLNILKSLCIYLAELKGFEFDDEPYYGAILKLMTFNNFNEESEERIQELLNEFVELDHELLMTLYEMKIKKYGRAVPTKVPLSTRPNKAILVAGTNLRELEMILEATKNRNIDVYTHGHMVNAHAYPLFKKYPNLVGNFGKAVDTYLLDFAAFPGAIFITKHSFKNLKNLYRSRVFTTDVLAPKGITIIKNYNFEPLIESALAAKGFEKTKDEGFIEINYDENKLMETLNDVTEKIEQGKIKNIFLVGIADNTKAQKDYFDKFLKLLKDDSFAVSFSYTNNQKNILHIETDFGCPILFKAIEALTKKIKIEDLNFSVMTTRCDVHTLPTVIKLKHLGVKNIYFNECGLIGLNPALIKAFREMFKLKEYTIPEADYKAIVNGQV